TETPTLAVSYDHGTTWSCTNLTGATFEANPSWGPPRSGTCHDVATGRLVMAVTGSFPRPLHQALHISFVLTVSMSISLSFTIWTAVYGVPGLTTICGKDEATKDPSAVGMIGLLVGFALIGAALISLAFVWRQLGRRCDLPVLVVAYNVFALLWSLAGALLIAVAAKTIMATLMANANCTSLRGP
ncbi:MAG: hypothetical protein ABIQ73_20150, partial [Acidimicrobiales bacterium]